MSQIRLSPYVNFQGRAAEAKEFYHRVLGGDLAAQFTAGDGHPDYPATVGDNMAIALTGTDKARLTKIFKDLADGGRVNMPLALQPWGAEVGWLKDKFSINWTVSIENA